MARSKKQEVDGSSTRSTSPSDRQSQATPESERPAGPLSVVIPSAHRDVVKVNKYNSTELKNACDDAVKRVSRLSTRHTSLVAFSHPHR